MGLTEFVVPQYGEALPRDRLALSSLSRLLKGVAVWPLARSSGSTIRRALASSPLIRTGRTLRPSFRDRRPGLQNPSGRRNRRVRSRGWTKGHEGDKVIRMAPGAGICAGSNNSKIGSVPTLVFFRCLREPEAHERTGNLRILQSRFPSISKRDRDPPRDLRVAFVFRFSCLRPSASVFFAPLRLAPRRFVHSLSFAIASGRTLFRPGDSGSHAFSHSNVTQPCNRSRAVA